MFYLARTPIPHHKDPASMRWVAVWDHLSSSDLIHWIHHPPAVIPALDGSMPQGIYSGGAVKNAPRPTLIYHVPGQGTCISIAQDDDLNLWEPLPQNPVIPLHSAEDEFIVFDPAGWYEDGKYYALIGNRNRRPGYEGDCTSLFISTDMVHWEYQGPFYQSDRQWTLEAEDAACPDFYPLGDSDKHMLLLHGHQPWRNITHYYIGEYRNERFYPEQHGRMSWLGGQLSGPESLIDDQGRNIFFGWLAESRLGGESLWGYDTEVVPGQNDQYAWASVVSLPRIMTYRKDGRLGLEPVPELKTLRLNGQHLRDVRIASGQETSLPGIEGDVKELFIEIDPMQAQEVGVKVRCSPDREEETYIVYNPSAKSLRIDFSKSTLSDQVAYRGFFTRTKPEEEDRWVQVAPLELPPDENLKLNIFLDKSVLEVFANGIQCITQRIYPSLAESQEILLFSDGSDASAIEVRAWDIEQVTPW